MNLSPIESKAIVYIMRPCIVGLAVMNRVDCDSFQVGWVGIKSYLYTILDPGEHIVSANPENPTDLKISLEGGKIYFIRFIHGGGKLTVVSEEKGRVYLKRCGLSKHNRYPAFPLSKEVEREPPQSNSAPQSR
jgi:hypothetical protein